MAPGEAIFIDETATSTPAVRGQAVGSMPCIFEFVYLARPDSRDRRHVGLRDARCSMGDGLAEKIRAMPEAQDIDVVIPIPDSSRAVGAGARDEARACRTARASSRTATSAARSSCRGRRCAGKRAPEAQRDRHRVQGQERAAGRRFDRARHDLARDRADGARCRRAQGVSSPRPRRRCASRTSTASTCRRRGELIATGRTEDEIAREIGADCLDLPGPRRAEERDPRRQSRRSTSSRRRASTATTSPAT